MIVGKKILKKNLIKKKILKKICNIIYPFQNTSHKIVKKQSKTKLIKRTTMGNQS